MVRHEHYFIYSLLSIRYFVPHFSLIFVLAVPLVDHYNHRQGRGISFSNRAGHALCTSVTSWKQK